MAKSSDGVQCASWIIDKDVGKVTNCTKTTRYPAQAKSPSAPIL